MDKRDIDTLVGTNIKTQRERAGYTQDEFSELIGLGPKSLSAVERGVVGVSLSTLLRICEVLHISADTLLYAQTQENDVQALTRQLERMTPAQFALTKDMITTMQKAFALEKE